MNSFSDFVRQLSDEDKKYAGESVTITLQALQEQGNKGISHKNFDSRFRLSGRIKDLRDAGHEIITNKEYFTNKSWYARYTLAGGR